MVEENLRRARLSLVISPQTKENLRLLAELSGLSVNEFVTSILDGYIKNAQNSELIEKLSAAKREFDETRRRLAEIA